MIQTERLILRNFTTDDYPEFVELIRDKMSSQWAAYDNQWPVDEGQLMYSLAWVIKQPQWFAVVRAEDMKLMGYVVAGVTEDGTECDVGYTLHSAYHRKGYAYEACCAIMRMRAADPKLKRFTIGTADCNYPSGGLIAKLGLTRISTEQVSFAKDQEDNPIVFSGSTYACSADEWR